jgi:chromosome segregation ATPase
MTIADAEFRKLKEIVEVLNGDRGDQKRSQAALRRAQLLEVETFIATVKESATAIRKSLEALVEEVRLAQGDILELTARIGNAEQNLQILEDELAELQQEVSALDTRIQSLQEQADGIEQQLAEAQGQITAVTGDLTTLQTTVTGVRDTLNGIRTRVGAVNIPGLASSDIGAAPTASDYNTLRADVANLRQALVNIKTAITT